MGLLQVAERAQVLGSGLLAKGCKPNPQQFVGIFAQNRPEVIVNNSSVHVIQKIYTNWAKVWSHCNFYY